MLIIIISSILSAFSTSFNMVIISRAICGAGCTFVFSANVSILTDVTKKEYLPEVMSFNHLATSLGGACGPIVGLAIAEAFGMTALFLSIIPVAS